MTTWSELSRPNKDNWHWFLLCLGSTVTQMLNSGDILVKKQTVSQERSSFLKPNLFFNYYHSTYPRSYILCLSEMGVHLILHWPIATLLLLLLFWYNCHFTSNINHTLTSYYSDCHEKKVVAHLIKLIKCYTFPWNSFITIYNKGNARRIDNFVTNGTNLAICI